MRIRFWPNDRPEDARVGPVARVLQDVRSQDPQLWALVDVRLRFAARDDTELAQFERQGWAERCPIPIVLCMSLGSLRGERKGW